MNNFNYQAYIKSGKIHGKNELLTESNNSINEFVDKISKDNALKDAANLILKKSKEAGKSVKDYMKDVEVGKMSDAMTNEDARTDAEQEGYKDGFEDAKDDVKDALSKMKVSELKAKIKEQILTELTLSEADEEEDDMHDNPGDIRIDHDYYAESKLKEEEVDVDIDVEDEVEVDAEADDIEIERKGVKAKVEVGLSPEEEIVQDSLKSAMDAAQALGSDKLADQIGNTITFFTRQFVVGNNAD